jgi:hypothetical protein
VEVTQLTYALDRIENVFAVSSCTIQVPVLEVGGVYVGIVMIEPAPVVIVQLKLIALQIKDTEAPSVTESLKAFPIKLELAQRDIDHEGVHQTFLAKAPLDKITFVLAAVVRAPDILKIYVQSPLSVIPAVIAAAADIQ